MKNLIFSTIGNKNFGDESMATTYIEKNIFEGKIEVATFYPENAKEILEIQEVRNPFLKLRVKNKFEMLKFMLKTLCMPNVLVKQIDLGDKVENYEKFVMCGGGNLNSKYLDTIIYMYLLCYVFKKKNKKIEFRPQSIGPFEGKKGVYAKLLMKRILKMSDKFLVREMESYKIANDMVKSQTIQIQIDDAWELTSKRLKSFELESILNRKTKKLALSVRPWNKKEKYEEKILQIVSKAVEQGYDIYFIPIAIGGNKAYIDNSFIKIKLKNKESVFFIEDYLNLDKIKAGNIKWLINKMDRCIGLSYHFNVYSKSLNKKTIALYSDEYYYIKNHGLYMLLDDEKSVVEIEKINIDMVEEFLK